MDAGGAYLELIDTLVGAAKSIGISRPACRLLSYSEQQQVFAALGVKLCAYSGDTGFESLAMVVEGITVIAFNANLSPYRIRREIYGHLMGYLVRRIFPDECASIEGWAESVARSALKHYLPNIKALAREAERHQYHSPYLEVAK